ncbi:MAG: HAMP domain-containing sensor histidine kinase [Acidimicrobiales bacterium]
MSKRLLSLRTRVLAAMLAIGLAGLAAAYLAFDQVEHGSERTQVMQDESHAARIVASQAAAGATAGRIAAFQRLLGDEQLIVYRSGHPVFKGPPNPDRPLVTVTSVFSGGRVVLVGDLDSVRQLSLKLTIVAAAAMALLLAGAVAGTGALVKGVTNPLARAARVADQMAAGDLSARMGEAGPQEFGRLARAFDSMGERLEKSDRAQRQFLADLAHEIVTPLNVVTGFAIAALDGTLEDDEQRREATMLINSESERLSSLLDDVRHLTFLDLAESVRQTRVDLDAAVDDVVARMRPMARSRGLLLVGHSRRGHNPRHVTVDADRRLIATVLANLVTNAIRYTPPGGRVDVSVTERRHEAILTVKDTGIGIAAEHKDKIFDRLYRVDEARLRATGGSGLGLAIVRRAVLRMGGRIELDSEPGAGAEFRVVLPASAGERSASGPGSEDRSGAGGSPAGGAGDSPGDLPVRPHVR